MPHKAKNQVLIIYTGGTIGSLPRDRENPLSPLAPAPIKEVMRSIPNFDPFEQTIRIENKSIGIGIYSFHKPVDSSNIQIEDWIEIARIIKNFYDDYDGFVVLHGTDILAYTASALAFIFKNLNKPVILTGSQRPISHTRTDATQNLVTAIEIAAARSLGLPVIPEVCVCFHNEIYRGCRVTKIDASGFKAFDSPNYPPLGEAGKRISIKKELLLPPHSEIMEIRDNLETNVISLEIFPGMSVHLLKSILSVEGLKGVVLKTYGSGNTPTHEEFLKTIREAVERGIIIVDVTQCKSGEVDLGLYETSEKLLAQGVLSGMDMTSEAALAKLMVILGKEEYKNVADEVLQINLRGEQRQSIYHVRFSSGKALREDVPAVLEQAFPMTFGDDRYDPEQLEIAVLRMTGVRLFNGSKKGRIELDFFIDLPDITNIRETDENPHFLGSILKMWDRDDGPANITFKITEQARQFIKSTSISKLIIVNRGAASVEWDKVDISLYANC